MKVNSFTVFGIFPYMDVLCLRVWGVRVVLIEVPPETKNTRPRLVISTALPCGISEDPLKLNRIHRPFPVGQAKNEYHFSLSGLLRVFTLLSSPKIVVS